ncbi:hypothetical protein PUR59_30475 [Streptomyces sp. SP18ES09]|uniref:hypothetical protein n=1 Tax=Streptomyces sp. SP18ES09 TaxID=3002532 RepID=UPI002E7987FC|nr:hypothetical protein [Streptomyces sp. SP18ES09]MEE1819327.1 hypothetical protein [Streptomyces sp. SP18ES09]
MIPKNAETPRLVSGAFQEVSAAGGLIPTVAQVPDDLEVADVLAAYWTEAKRHFLAHDFPQYATDEWRELPFEDPRKFAGLMRFAEMWRRFGADIAGELDEVLKPHQPIYQRPTLAELDQRHAHMIARNRKGAAA